VKNYQHLLSVFNDHLSAYVSELSARQPAQLYDPERYILSLGGKRVRPLLSLVACELMGGEAEKALNCALAVELFHNFSLVHDDILDAAPLRRGMETVHHKYGSNVAILSGDAMLVKALACLETYSDKEFRQLSTLLHATAVEVCEGQQMDMNFEVASHVSVEEYIQMISLKTAVLLGCSLRMGAVCAGASPSAQEYLYGFGKHLGIAFQLLDDLLDCFPSSDNFGKKTGGDIIANKKTFLWLKAMELSNESERKELLTLAGNKNEQEKIEGVLKIFKTKGVDKLCRAEADKHTEQAISLLSKVPGKDEHKKQLSAFALDLLHRQS
jgi:geranylgeranyl diphosphate synthase type II